MLSRHVVPLGQQSHVVGDGKHAFELGLRVVRAALQFEAVHHSTGTCEQHALWGQAGAPCWVRTIKHALDHQSLFKYVAVALVEQATVLAQVRYLVDRALRIALSERKVTALILPNDLQEPS